MAKKRTDFANFQNADTLIGLGVEIEGNLGAEGDIQINGQFKGDVATLGDVIIGDHAEVKADIKGANVYVAGVVEGNIVAEDKIEIYETGRVTGNVVAQGLVIEPGGLLTGKSVMHPEEESKPNTSPTFEVEETQDKDEG